MSVLLHECMPFAEWINEAARQCYENSKAHGFWYEGEISENVECSTTGGMVRQTIKTKPWNFGEKIALIHSEISEALEKHRKTVGKGLPDTPDEHCPEFGGIEIEFADAIIRLFDTAAKMNMRLGEAIEAKMTFNKTRPVKHGKAY